jgi:hypothetical protein
MSSNNNDKRFIWQKQAPRSKRRPPEVLCRQSARILQKPKGIESSVRAKRARSSAIHGEVHTADRPTSSTLGRPNPSYRRSGVRYYGMTKCIGRMALNRGKRAKASGEAALQQEAVPRDEMVEPQ